MIKVQKKKAVGRPRKDSYNFISCLTQPEDIEVYPNKETLDNVKNNSTRERLLKRCTDIVFIQAKNHYKCNVCDHVLSRVMKDTFERHCRIPGHCLADNKEARELGRIENVFSDILKETAPISGPFSNTPINCLTSRMVTCQAFLKAGTPLNHFKSLRHIIVNGDLVMSVTTLSKFIPAVRDAYVFSLMNEILPPQNDTLVATPKLLRSDETMPYSVIWDGSTFYREVYIFALRMATSDFEVKYRICKVAHFPRSGDGRAIAQKLEANLFPGVTSGQFHADQYSIVGFIRDGLAANNVALRALSATKCHGAIDVVCSAHALSISGDHFKVQTLNTFWNCYVMVFLQQHHTLARDTLADKFQVKMDTYSVTRWWSKFICLQLLFLLLLNLEFYDWIQDSSNDSFMSGVNGKQLRQILADRGDSWLTLLAELGAVVSLGKILVSETYNLESDSASIFDLYEVLSPIFTYMNSPDLSVVSTIARFAEAVKLNKGDDDDTETGHKRKSSAKDKETRKKARTEEDDSDSDSSDSDESDESDDDTQLERFQSREEIEEFVKGIVVKSMKPAIKYLKKIYLKGRMRNVERLANAARYFHPRSKDLILGLSAANFDTILTEVVSEMNGGDKGDFQTVMLFKIHKQDLITQLPAYKHFVTSTIVDVVGDKNCFSRFWNESKRYPNLATYRYVARCLLTLAPTSAFVERAFSCMNSSFDKQQNQVLPDVMEGVLMAKKHPEPNVLEIKQARGKMLNMEELAGPIIDAEESDSGDDDDSY